MSFTTPQLFTGEAPKTIANTPPSLVSLTVSKPITQEIASEMGHPFLDHKSIMILIALFIMLFIFWKK